MERENLWRGLVLSLFLTLSFNIHAFSIPQSNEAVAASKLAHIQLNAAAGDPDTQYLLGLMRLSGRYTEKDVAKGLYWLRLSAEADHAKAVQALADLYFEGKMMKRDLANAERWYLKLATGGNRWAQFRLGFIYASGGFGVERHCGKALNQFRHVGDNIALGNVAWILATCPEAEFRNGIQALALSKKLLEEDDSDPSNLDNLAAAYAELGLFTDAVAAQQQAISILTSGLAQKDASELEHLSQGVEKKASKQIKIDEFRARLKNYQEHKAYREIVPLMPE